MTTYRFTDPEGNTHEVTGPEGGTEAEAFQMLQQSQGSAPAAAPAQSDPSFMDSAKRGAGLAVRNVAFAPAKLATGLADIAGTALNTIPAGASMLSESMGGPSIDARIPTDNRQFLNDQLDQFLPSPEGPGERIADAVGEFGFTGGLAGVGLANRVAPHVMQKLPVMQAGKVGQARAGATPAVAEAGGPGGVIDNIGRTFAQNPGAATLAEATGGAGSEIGAMATEESDSALARGAGPLVGGLAGALSPTALLALGKQLMTKVAQPIAGAFTPAGTERRAAQRVQSLSDDPARDAQLIADSPKGVSGAQASESPNLLKLERNVLEETPVKQAKVRDELVEAQETHLKQLAEETGPGTNPKVWTEQVMSRVTPDDSVGFKAGHPDEMVADITRSYGTAYEKAKGFPIQTQSVNVEGGNVPLRTMLADAVEEAGVLTTPEIQAKAMSRVEKRLVALEAKGTRVGGPDDAPIFQVMSDDIIDLRHTLRVKASAMEKAGVTNTDVAEEAELLRAMSQTLTKMLETQLPDSASAGLRATDARYAQFKTVENAVVRSGEKGLTPEALRTSLKQRNSQGQVARGETGDLGTLAEQGKSVVKLAGKGRDDEIERMVRTMTPEQTKQVRSDIIQNAMKKSELKTTGGRADGEALAKRLRDNRSSLKAAGASDEELGRLDQMVGMLTSMQKKAPQGVMNVLDDEISFFTVAFAKLVSARMVRRLVQATGAGGAGTLTLSGTFSKRILGLADSLDGADVRQLITDAIDDKALMASLLVKPTDSLARRASATRTIKAWLANKSETEETE